MPKSTKKANKTDGKYSPQSQKVVDIPKATSTTITSPTTATNTEGSSSGGNGQSLTSTFEEVSMTGGTENSGPGGRMAIKSTKTATSSVSTTTTTTDTGSS